MSDTIRNAIYQHLEKKFAQLNRTLDLCQQTELDSVLWDLSQELYKGTPLYHIYPDGRIEFR